MKSAITRYGYLNAKLRARLANIRDSGVIDLLLDSKTFLQALETLEKTSYGELSEVYKKTGDIQMLEKTLEENEIKMRQEVVKNLDGQSAVVCSFFLMKMEIDNLKNVIRIWFDTNVLGGNCGFRLNYVLRQKIYSDILWDDVINSVSWEDILKALENTCYYPCVSDFKAERISSEGLAFFEMALDFFYYSSLIKAVKHLNSTDRKVASSVIKEDLDLKNILILIRYGFYYDVPLDRLQTLILPSGKLYDSLGKSNLFNEADGIEKLKAELTRAFPSFDLQRIFSAENKTDLLTRSLELEKLLSEERDRNYKAILHSDPFTIGLIMAYFFKYDHYDKCIRVILHGKFYNWPENKIMEVLG